MAQKDKFWNRHATRYAKNPVANEDVYQRKLKETQDLLEPHMTVLEFGCGTGTTALLNSKYVSHIRAIDISSKMLDIAKSKASDAGITNVTFDLSDIESLNESGTLYDVIMGHSILHLLEDKESTIAKVHTLLKPGGYFISSTACLGNMSGFWKLILPLGYKLGLLPLVKFFDKEHLEDSISKAGFKIQTSWRPGPKNGVFIIVQKEV